MPIDAGWIMDPPVYDTVSNWIFRPTCNFKISVHVLVVATTAHLGLPQLIYRCSLPEGGITS